MDHINLPLNDLFCPEPLLKRILIIQTAFLGDVILATGLVETLAQAYPEAKIDYLVRKGNEPVLANNPILSQVWVWDKSRGKLANLLRLLRSIRKARYDWIINAHRFASSGLLTALSRAKTTSGFDKNPWSRFYSKRVPHHIGDGTHETERNHRLIDWMVKVPRQMPRVYPSAEDYQIIKNYQSEPYVCMAPASVWFTKQWPAEKWIELINLVTLRYKVFLLGSKTDTTLCSEIMSQVGQPDRVEVVAGSLSLLQSAALMEAAAMNYVNDSAPLHLCSATNAPVTAIYCSTVPSFGFGPLSDKSRVVETPEKLDCRPCGLHGYKACPEAHFRCALNIEVGEVGEVVGKS